VYPEEAERRTPEASGGDDAAGDHRPDLVQGVLSDGDAEVAAAAADRPEQIRVLVGARAHHPSVGSDVD
jgi:hypothetical protein